MRKIVNCRNTITHHILKMYSEWIEDLNVKPKTLKLRPWRLDPRERTKIDCYEITLRGLV